MSKQKKKRFVSIRLKLFSRIALIFLAAILLFSGLNIWGLPMLYAKSAEKTMIEVADAVEAIQADSTTFLREMTILEKENSLSIDVYQRDGTQIYFGNSEFASTNGKVEISKRKTLPDGSHFERRHFVREDAVFLVYDRVLKNGKAVQIYSKMNSLDKNTKAALLLTNSTSLAALLFALFFIYFYAKRVTRPLIEMRDVTKGIANLDFKKKCSADSADEIGELSESINRLSDSLSGALLDLQEKNAQLQQDIEKEQALEKMRQDFIASVSHELKTPISIISGYAEGAGMLLSSGKSDKAKAYCDIIEAEAERMNTLVLELLELSKYEAGAMPLHKETFDLCATFADYLHAAELDFSKAGISIETEFPATAPVYADASKILMVFNNYVQNAKAHADGAKRLSLRIEDADDTFYRFSVRNTGAPIAEEDLQKVWNSFYRADKAHSRKEGRFGLGLSIVQEIQKLHGASCGVQNMSDGVLFWATVEKAR